MFEERNKILASASKLESKWKMREGVSRIVAVNSWVKVNESLGFPKQSTARIAIAVQCYSVLLYYVTITASSFDGSIFRDHCALNQKTRA